jgi:hypothetical protein
MPIKHSFVSAKSDGADTSLVRPSDWNAEHVVEGTLTMDSTTAPSAVSTKGQLYVKTDGGVTKLYFKGDDGTEHGPFQGSVSGTNTGDQTITLTGDVTGSGTGSFAATIGNDKVTYAKIQNVSATDRILGRSSAGAGDVEEITCTAAGRALLDDADATAQRTTLGLGTLATQSGTFSGTSSGTNTGDQNLFSTIAVSGQSNVVADTTSDTLTLAAGSNVTITTNATTDTITIAASGGSIDGSGTANQITYWVDTDTLGALTTATYPSLTELSYVKGVTSAIQTQLGARATLTGANAFTGANTFTNSTGQIFRQAATQDGILLRGRSGGTSSRTVELIPGTLGASRTLTLPDTSGTLPVGTGTTNELTYWSGTNTISTLSTATYPSLTELSYVKGATSSIQTQLDKYRVQSFVIAASDEITALTGGTAKVKFRMPYAFTLTGVRASLSIAQTSGNIFTVDINEAGTSILSTKLTIDNTETTSTTAATAAVISDSSLADDAEISIDIDQVGDGTAKGLKVTLIGYRT